MKISSGVVDLLQVIAIILLVGFATLSCCWFVATFSGPII